MAKIDPNFQHDMYRFLHRPIRQIDAEQGDNFLERFLLGPQNIFEDSSKKIATLVDIINPAKTRADLLQFLKDHVGFTKELSNITQDLDESDLRKLISLAVALWKEKGTEPGYQNIVRLFTGKAVRVFNYFDFRLIVGEKAFGEEQLGEDSWLISVPGVEASQDPTNTVISLIKFDNNTKDGSLLQNDAIPNGNHHFFETPSVGFPQNVDKYIRLQGGLVTQPHTNKYDLSGDFTVEIFFRLQNPQSNRSIIKKMNASGLGFKLDIDSATNTIGFELNDGVNTVSTNFIATADIDDNQVRHITLVVDRAQGARIYLNGSESSGLIALGALGDLSNSSPLVLGADDIGVNPLLVDLSSFRFALNPVYDVSLATFTPPITGFIEFQEELLHEFETDIRIVEEEGLNRPLILRILNLMRPSSERLNAIFIKFFDDFSAGSGRFVHLAGTSRVNTNQELEIDPGSVIQTDVLNDSDFMDIVLQMKINDTDPAGGEYSVLFFIQDIDNFYEFRVDTVNRELSLHKTVGGVSSQIGANTTVDIVPRASYIFTVNTSYDSIAGDTLLQTFLDSNRVHLVRDSAFEKGKFGLKTSSSTTAQLSEVEMFETPLETERVFPGIVI